MKSKGTKKIIKAAAKKVAVKNSKASEKSLTKNKGVEKKYSKSAPSCKVTFRLPKEAAAEAHSVTVVGNFNGWDEEATPMKRLKTGEFKITIELPSGHEYRFKYLIDGCRWENDWCADRYLPNPYGCDDSVIIV